MPTTLTSAKCAHTHFTLAAVFTYTTVWALLAALSPAIGIGASIGLLLMAIAIGAKQGLLAITMSAAASLATDAPIFCADSDGSLPRQLLVLSLAGGICAWQIGRQKTQ